MATVKRGKALVAQLRTQAGVRDPEALAAYLGRFKKARKAGMSVAKAKAAAKGASGGNPKPKASSAPQFKSHEEARAWADKNIKGADRIKDFGKASPAAVGEVLASVKEFETKTGSRLPAYLAFNNRKVGGRANGRFRGDEQTIYMREVKDAQAFNQKLREGNAEWEREHGTPWTVTNDLRGVFFHEAGHAADQAMNMKGSGVSSNVEAQRGNLSEYSKKNVAERWAEAFAAVATGHKNAKNLPERYRKIIEEMLGKG